MTRLCIITVAYEAAGPLEKTLRSVACQTWREFDYIVVDGGSHDGTPDVIGRHAGLITRWVSEPDRGIYDAMNKGIAMAASLADADGEERYVLMLNADDTLYRPTTLAEIAQRIDGLEDKPDVVCGAWMIHPEHGAYLQCPGDLTQLPRRFVINHQATLVRLSVLRRHPFDHRYRLAGDFSQLSGLYLAGYRFVTCPDIVVSDMVLNEGATDRHWRLSVKEGFDVVKANGCYRRGEMEWLLLRKGCVRALKRLLPRSLSHALFGWLARHYKAM